MRQVGLKKRGLAAKNFCKSKIENQSSKIPVFLEDLMRPKIGVFLAFFILVSALLAACGGAGATPTQPAPTQPASTPTATGSTAAAKAVENYLAGVVSKDVNKVSTLSCKDWEQQAIQELDSLQAVTAQLSGVACSQSGMDGANALVKCTGKILITYNTENQELDLSLRTYEVAPSGGDWLVCGYKQ
jgi:hypothetical protein